MFVHNEPSTRANKKRLKRIERTKHCMRRNKNKMLWLDLTLGTFYLMKWQPETITKIVEMCTTASGPPLRSHLCGLFAVLPVLCSMFVVGLPFVLFCCCFHLSFLRLIRWSVVQMVKCVLCCSPEMFAHKQIFFSSSSSSFHSTLKRYAVCLHVDLTNAQFS